MNYKRIFYLQAFNPKTKTSYLSLDLVVLAAKLFVISFLIGCAGPFRSRQPLSVISSDILVKQIRQHASQLQTFYGWARMTIISSAGSFRGTMKVAVKEPDSLWIKVEGPLGIDMVIARFGHGNGLLYNPMENIVYKGSVQKMWVGDLMPTDLSPSNLVLGLLVPMSDSLQYCSIEGRRYVLNSKVGEQIWVEPKGPVVTRWERRDINGEVLWVWEGKGFMKKKGIRLPRTIKMTGYYPRQQITLFYEWVKANSRIKSEWCKIRIPEGVETIEL